MRWLLHSAVFTDEALTILKDGLVNHLESTSISRAKKDLHLA